MSPLTYVKSAVLYIYINLRRWQPEMRFPIPRDRMMNDKMMDVKGNISMNEHEADNFVLIKGAGMTNILVSP